MAEELEIVAFAATAELGAWLERHGDAHPGVWVRLQKARSTTPSIGFHD